MVGADGLRKFFKFELSRFTKTSSKFLIFRLKGFVKKDIVLKNICSIKLNDVTYLGKKRKQLTGSIC